MRNKFAAFAAVLALSCPAWATLTTTTNTASYTGNGSTTAFTVPFKFLANADLVVTVAGVTQALGSNYTVKGAGAATGTVTFTVAPPAGQTVLITRRVPITQTTSLRQSRSFDPATIENALDRLTMQNQQLANTAASAAATGLLTAADWVRFNNVVLQPLNQFQAAGTGSVARGIGEKLSDVVSVKDFGALANGSDDSGRLQNAINAAAGKTLDFVPGASYTINSTLNISTTAGLILRCNGSTITGPLDILIQFTGASSNITFQGCKFVSTGTTTGNPYGLIMGLMAAPLVNIRVIDCDFTAPTDETNGIKLDLSNVASSLVGLEISGSRFVNLGRMAIEIVNHTFDDVSRFDHVRIIGNRMDGLGLASIYGMAVSLSGMGKNISVSNNTISGARNIGLEIVGPWQTTLANNILRNLQASAIAISVGKPASATSKLQGIALTSNIIEGNGGISFQPTGMQNATITGNIVTGTGKASIEASDYVTLSGNTFDVTNQILFTGLTYVTASGNRFTSRTNAVGFNPTITNTTLSTWSGTTFQSERGTGLLVNGTSSSNIFTGCIFSNEASTSAGAPLQFDGASATGNLVTASQFRRTAAGGTTWQQATGATNNNVGLAIANTINPNAADTYTLPLSLATGGNGWLQTVKLNGQFVWSDASGLLRMKSSAPTADTDGAGVACASATSCGVTSLAAGTATVTVRSGCRPLCTDTTAAAAVKCSVAATTLTITGTGTDAIGWFCY
jgi:hypothetical protein